jgi:hypothetical protein
MKNPDAPASPGRNMATRITLRIVVAEPDQVLHAKLARVAERHRWAEFVSLFDQSFTADLL